MMQAFEGKPTRMLHSSYRKFLFFYIVVLVQRKTRRTLFLAKCTFNLHKWHEENILTWQMSFNFVWLEKGKVFLHCIIWKCFQLQREAENQFNNIPRWAKLDQKLSCWVWTWTSGTHHKTATFAAFQTISPVFKVALTILGGLRKASTSTIFGRRPVQITLSLSTS